jgi:hypothetical protein
MPSSKEVIKTNIFSIDPDIFCGLEAINALFTA